MQEIIIVIDAGGTTISAAAASPELKIVSDIHLYPSNSKDNANDIVGHFINIIHDAFNTVFNGNQTCIGVSIGFPGPFDYVKGISYMKNIDKYDHLYDYPFKDALIKGLHIRPLPNQQQDIVFTFANDATMFVLGEYVRLAVEKNTRLMGITLGTGCGSTFIESGKLVAGEKGIPEDGMIYHLPYQDSILDDYISKRGILRIAKEHGYDSCSTDIVTIFNDAMLDNPKALNVFSDFGIHLLDALRKTMNTFQPDIIVIGGQIAKAYRFFGYRLDAYSKANGITINLAPDATASALIGACSYFNMINSLS